MAGESSLVQLDPQDRSLVEAVLQREVPHLRVWLFGSRTQGRSRPFSDLDLGLEGDQPVSLETRAAVAEAFDESDLPFRVDLVDLTTADPVFVERVKRTGVRLVPG